MLVRMQTSSGGGGGGIRETFWSVPVGSGYAWNFSFPDDTARTGALNSGDYMEVSGTSVLKAKKNGTYIIQTRTNNADYVTSVATYSAGDTILSDFRNSCPYFVGAMDS